MKHVGKVFPGHIYRFLFEIVAERPVAKHFKHCVVIGVVTHFFEVVVLAAHTQTFLRVGNATALGAGVAKNDILELVHSRVGKHQRGVIFDDHRCRWHDMVAFRFKIVFE